MCFSDVIRVLYCLPQFRFAIIWIANQWLWLDRSWYQNANKYTRFMQLIRIIIQLAKIRGGGAFLFWATVTIRSRGFSNEAHFPIRMDDAMFSLWFPSEINHFADFEAISKTNTYSIAVKNWWLHFCYDFFLLLSIDTIFINILPL